MRDDLLLEIADDSAPFFTIGSLGITPDSWVVIVTAPNPGEPPIYGLANGTRLAVTLIYAGVAKVQILPGGYPQWVADGYGTTMEIPDVDPVTSGLKSGQFNRIFFCLIYNNDIASKRRQNHKNKILRLFISICYNK